MKSKVQSLLAVALIGAVLICPVMATSSFPDVDENANYAEAVEYLNDIGIMRGDNRGNFNPDNPVTRAEMATIICNMLNESEDLAVSDNFTDVPTTHWANKYVTKAAELGIVSGYGNGKFGPDDTVNYEQAVKMIVSAAGHSDYSNEQGGYPDGYLKVAAELGYTTGLSPQKGELLKRWQVAVITSNALFY